MNSGVSRGSRGRARAEERRERAEVKMVCLYIMEEEYRYDLYKVEWLVGISEVIF